jgi:branched-chain amino acid transport system substrate-binding protein
MACCGVLLALALGACGGESGGGDAGEPVKIGVVLPYTGNFGLYGKPMEAALRARLAQAGDKAGERPVELIFEDGATDPGTAVSKINKLVDQDGVAAVVCCVNGASTLAAGPILAERKIPQLGPIPNPSGLSKFATAAVAAPTAERDATLLGERAAKELGYHSAAILASDMSYGQEVARGFEKGFTGAGGTVVKKVFPPFGAQDFGSYLSQVGDADVLFGGFAGADAIRFVKQYDNFGVKGKIPLIGHGPLVTELILQQEGKAAVGIGAGFYYSSSLDLPANQEFKDGLAGAAKGVPPSHFTAGAWATGGVLLDAIGRARGDVGDGEQFARAIRATKLDAPWGPLQFDPGTGYAPGPGYYYEVVDDGGSLHHDVKGEMGGNAAQ